MKPLFSVALLASMFLHASLAIAAEPKPAPPKQITNSIGMKLTLVPSGEFMMGSKESAEETAAFFNVAVHTLKLTLRDFARFIIKGAWTLSNSRKMFARGGSYRIGWSTWS